MKNTYIKPIIEAVALQTESGILAASGETASSCSYEGEGDFSTGITQLAKETSFDLFGDEEE